MRAELPVAWILLAPLLVAGCVAPEPPPADAPGVLAVPGAEASTLERALGGRILYRLAGHDATSLRYEGDSPQFCFSVPPGATRLAARLDWDVPTQMVLAFGAPGFDRDPSKVHAAPPEQPPRALLPPLSLDLDAPASGQWTANAVPWAAGAAVRWTLALELEVAGAAPEGAFQPDGGACFEERRAGRPGAACWPACARG